MHVRSLADSNIASAFENLLNSKVDRAFNETVFGQHEYLSGYMPTFSEGAITWFFLFLDQSCLWFVPPYVIQKFDSHICECYQTFLPNVIPVEIPVFCCRCEVVQW